MQGVRGLVIGSPSRLIVDIIHFSAWQHLIHAPVLLYTVSGVDGLIRCIGSVLRVQLCAAAHAHASLKPGAHGGTDKTVA